MPHRGRCDYQRFRDAGLRHASRGHRQEGTAPAQARHPPPSLNSARACHKAGSTALRASAHRRRGAPACKSRGQARVLSLEPARSAPPHNFRSISAKPAFAEAPVARSLFNTAESGNKEHHGYHHQRGTAAEGCGFSCLGFDVVFKHLRVFVERLGEAVVGPVPESAKGSLAQYEQYRLAVAAHAKNGDTRTRFDLETPAKVRGLLGRCRQDGTPVRVFYGDPETGRDCLEEFDTVGRIGRSTASMKVVPPVSTRWSMRLFFSCCARCRLMGGQVTRSIDFVRHLSSNTSGCASRRSPMSIEVARGA